MIWWHKPGQEVVNFYNPDVPPTPPEMLHLWRPISQDVVYVIRDVYLGTDTAGNETVGLRFEGIICNCGIGGSEVGYDARCFRPVTKTDISIFDKIRLDAEKEIERADREYEKKVEPIDGGCS